MGEHSGEQNPYSPSPSTWCPSLSTLVEHQNSPCPAPPNTHSAQVECSVPANVNGKTQGFPAAGPDVVTQERFVSGAAVVVMEVVLGVVGIVVVVVVKDVVVVETVVVLVPLVGEDAVVVVVGEGAVVAPGQVEEQRDSLPRMWVPFSWVLVEHQAEERRSVEAQEL